MEWWLPVLSVAGSLTVVAGGYLANRKLGISEGQKTLVTTLQGTVAAQDDRIKLIEREKDECKEQLARHEVSIASLRSAVGEIRRENHQLHRQLDAWEDAIPGRKAPKRPRRSAE